MAKEVTGFPASDHLPDEDNREKGWGCGYRGSTSRLGEGTREGGGQEEQREEKAAFCNHLLPEPPAACLASQGLFCSHCCAPGFGKGILEVAATAAFGGDILCRFVAATT